MAKVTVDATSFFSGVNKALSNIDRAILQSVNDVANEILRISSREVPLDIGDLSKSGDVEPETATSVIVGYNRVYAARLHENPQYNFQHGRKGKYLEDPIKLNLQTFKSYIEDALKHTFK